MDYKLKFTVVKELPNLYFLARNDAVGDGVNFPNLKEVLDYILTCQDHKSQEYLISINLSRSGFSREEYGKVSNLTKELVDVTNEILLEKKKKVLLEELIKLYK